MMLINSGNENFKDDGFEWSIDESHIFTGVYFGKDLNTNINGFFLSETSGNRNLFKRTANSLFSNSGSSDITSQVEPCFALEDSRKNSAPWGSSQGHALFSKNEDEGNNELMKQPTDELSYLGYYPLGSLHSSGPFSRQVSDISQSASPVVSDSVTCRIVESYCQGVTSSCYLMKRLARNNAKEVDASKSISSPISQESSASKLLIASPFVNVANDPLSSSPLKKMIKSELHQMSLAEGALDGICMNNPKALLRSHFQNLLMAAGWEIGRRKRENNISGEFLYYSPWRRKPIREVRRVWNLCGRRLLADAKVVLQEDNKQWTDMTNLWSDLSSTLVKIEKELSNETDAAALAQRWYLLDPFVNLVFIDKKLNTLKAGKSVKARRSTVSGSLKKKNDAILPSDYLEIYGNQLEKQSGDQHCDSSPRKKRALTICKAKEAEILCREYSGNRRSGRITFSEALRPDSTYGYVDSCLIEVPIMYEDTDFINGRSEIKSPRFNHAQNSPSFDLQRSYDDEDTSFEVKDHNSVDSFEADKTYSCQIVQKLGYQLEGSLNDHESCKSDDRWLSLLENSYLVDVDIKVMQNVAPIHQVEEQFTRVPCYWKGTKQEIKLERSDSRREIRRMSSTCQLMDVDHLTSAMIRSKSFRSSAKQYTSEVNPFKSEPRKKHKRKKGSCRLVPRNLIKGKKHIEGKFCVSNERTILSWLIDRGFVSLGEVIQYRSPKDYTVVTDGSITRDGILCKCCNKLFSFSKFKAHAGFRLKGPCLDIFMESGKSFTLCELEAWSAEFKARKTAIQPVKDWGMDQSDDKCGLCGDMGELICCDNCPSTFHQACLETQELPEGSWYCWHCCCRVCGGLVNDRGSSKSCDTLTCLQCEQKYHRACLKKKGCRVVPSDDRFCCQSCQEMYSGLASRMGFVNDLSDGFSWTILKCFYGDQRIHSVPEIAALEAECNAKVAVALTIMEERFLSMVDSRTGIDIIPHVLYNWRSKYPRLNFCGFYTMVLERDDVLLSVASIRIHGVTVAEMPLVATCSKYQRQGMCRRLLHSIEEMLKSFKVEKLVISALPSLVEAWTIGFGFTLLENHERESFRKFNLMVFPGTVMLKKQIYESPTTLPEITLGNAGTEYSSCLSTINTTETSCFGERPTMGTRKLFYGRSSANEATYEMEGRHFGSKNVQTDLDQQDRSLCKQFRENPWEEPVPSLGRIRIDVSTARENFFRMSQKALVSRNVAQES